MAVQNFNRKLLDLKRWTVMPTLAPATTTGGTFVMSSRLAQQRQLYMGPGGVPFLYDPFEDGWIQLPAPGLAGTFGGGACGTAGAIGPTGTATGGTTTTVATNLTLARALNGYDIEITGGPGAGERRTILRNTQGANATITVSTPFSTAITASSTYRLITPRWYVLNAGTVAAGSFRVYCFALNTWTTLSQTGLPATWGTDAKMVATPSFGDNGVPVIFAPAALATAGAATTITRGTANWTANQWTNFQVRITAGTGAGQIRTIASNTATVLTVSAAWATTPDTTSQFVIEGNDDHIYLMGNAAVTLFRYSISSNTWTTLAPVAARAAAPAQALSGHWVFNVPSSIDASWSDENNIINGRRIYSFRGSSAALDYYDIAANTWVSNVPYAPGQEVFGAGSKYVYAAGYIYLTSTNTGRWARFSPAESTMIGWTANVYPQGAPVVGDTAFDTVEPETGVRFINMLLNFSNVHMRCMVI